MLKKSKEHVVTMTHLIQNINTRDNLFFNKTKENIIVERKITEMGNV